MISPFEVYLVMQLDKVILASFLVGGVVALPLGILTFAEGMDEDIRLLKWLGGISFSAGLFFVLLATLLPSTKTAATMFILPAITSDEVVKPLGNEAKELYDLAKDALRKAVDAPAPKSSQEVEKN